MEERLRRRVAELGYECSLQESCVNIAWLYLLGSFDPKVVQCFLDEDGSAKTSESEEEYDLVWASTSAMLDEGERVDRLADLAPPSVKTPQQVLDSLNRRVGAEPIDQGIRRDTPSGTPEAPQRGVRDEAVKPARWVCRQNGL